MTSATSSDLKIDDLEARQIPILLLLNANNPLYFRRGLGPYSAFQRILERVFDEKVPFNAVGIPINLWNFGGFGT